MPTSTKLSLCPAQQQVFDWFAKVWESGICDLFHCTARNGGGRSTVLGRLHETFGGKLLRIGDFVQAAKDGHPLGLEDALYRIIMEAFQDNDVVIVDDYHLATAALGQCHFYPRAGYIDSPMAAVAAYVNDSGKKLVVGTDGNLSFPLRVRSIHNGIEKFTADDYRFLCETFLQRKSPELDFEKLFRFAPRLNCHQLKQACAWCGAYNLTDTEHFIEYLRSQHLTSNVELGEVARVDLKSLKGVDDVLKSLDVNIVVPLENDELANELSLRPKRGVLLVGPPGTGKTTVGRALAHRLKGKFFLVDGTFISGTRDFYQMISNVFRAAQENAPSVIFIDDSDVIFESGEEHGLYRYLLTMLDGLESESAGRVCVMMTAMDVGNLPPALIRSGRIELWLEMRLPDESARTGILEQLLVTLPKPLNEAEVGEVVSNTDGFTGADMKRLVEDSKALYAYDRVRKNELQSPTGYFLVAAKSVRESKAKYAEAESKANAARPSRPSWFSPYSSFASVPDEDS